MLPDILYPNLSRQVNRPMPECFHDLKLSRILPEAGKTRAAARFSEIFCSGPAEKEEILFRQEIMKDFEEEEFCQRISEFSEEVLSIERIMKENLGEESDSEDLMDCSLVYHMAARYCHAVRELSILDRSRIHSGGMLAFLSALDRFLEDASYEKLQNDMEFLQERFSRIRFCMLIRDGKIKIRPYEGEQEAAGEIRSLFARFCQNEAKREAEEPPRLVHIHHMDEAVLSLLQKWYPEEIRALRTFAQDHRYFMEKDILKFADDVSFYLKWQEIIRPLKAQGLSFCYPEIREDGRIFCEDGFDLALALDLRKNGERVVPNSFSLDGEEQVLVVTGPNQGGKTTFARAFGQAFYLASLGVSIPGTGASLPCVDAVYTHFNKEEDPDEPNGKLKDDILRLREIMKHATKNSVLVINEIYSSTTLEDAIWLGKKMMEEIIDKKCPAICVTFLDELAEFDCHTVSMMSTLVENSEERSYRIIRKKADGMAYAIHLAQKYGLDRETLKRRLSHEGESAISE